MDKKAAAFEELKTIFLKIYSHKKKWIARAIPQQNDVFLLIFRARKITLMILICVHGIMTSHDDYQLFKKDPGPVAMTIPECRSKTNSVSTFIYLCVYCVQTNTTNMYDLLGIIHNNMSI